MEEEILTIEEVAKYLRVSDRTIYDWAQKGEIPAGKLGTAWRFKKTEIEKWVNDKLAFNKTAPQIDIVQIKTMLTPQRILFLECVDKRSALLALSENLSTAPQIKNSAELTKGILQREELMSTAIGKGIAIPHIRLNSITDLVVSIGISKIDITDFNPLDDIPVRLLIMIAASSSQHAYYLQTLAYFSRRLKDMTLYTALLNAKTTDEVYHLISECG